jgi:hypothetical protein
VDELKAEIKRQKKLGIYIKNKDEREKILRQRQQL